jgi:hypothetical protein
MKDEVKITVIATGFRGDNHVQRHERAVTAAAAAISQARTASAYIAPRPEVRAAEPPPPAHSDAPQPVAPPPITQRPAVPQRETTSIADVKSTVKNNYGEDDLDVPAFIRKRNESSS